ncbi:BQ5605_C028g10519 [Microbotryum silenes-dioicae]|uniref:BQ5605_C028g10519 protein n=1 Tax=Microbotryum silenes-dioicae TaxID=796604 RepID=A0A2X0MM19_9BASI|nr:BQ5605_C028g10519 [Microbotryum silenes-dioicae]
MLSCPQTVRRHLRANKLTAKRPHQASSSLLPQYGAPPAQQQQYGAPPQGQYGQPPPAGQYGQSPAGQYGQPPQGQYGQPPAQAGAYGAPPPQQGYGAPPSQYGAPPQQGYGASSPGQYGAPPPNQCGQPAAPVGYAPQAGYAAPAPIPHTYLGTRVHPSENPLLPAQEKLRANQAVDGYDPAKDVETIKTACKGFGTNEDKITLVVTALPAVRIPPLIYAYKAREGKDMIKLLEKELRGNYETLILQILAGPLMGDVELVKDACKGLGTNEMILTEVLIGRTPLAIDLLKAAFQAHTGKSMEKEVLDELSMKTKSAMAVALLGDWRDQPNMGRTPENEAGQGGAGGVGGFVGAAPAQLNQQMVQDDAQQLKKAIQVHVTGEVSIDQQHVIIMPRSSIVFARSPAHLQAVQAQYKTLTRAALTHNIKRCVDGHLKEMYLFALEGGKRDTNGCWRDAKRLHDAMAGLGTKDLLLIMRIVRAHWDRQRFQQLKGAYRQKYSRELLTDVMKETSGDYRDALIALINAP